MENKRFAELLNKDNTPISDNERTAFFFIIAGNDDLYSKRNFIYDFKERVIKPDYFSGFFVCWFFNIKLI